jgi:ABC-type nitrate/sulfonate/bicarbonate transport system substrate-binding protein
MTIVKVLSLLARVSAMVAALVALTAHAQSAPPPIRIAAQPGNYAAIAYKLGYWQDAGLAPSLQTYLAGVPQIKAHADWNFGTIGAVPALIGARDYDLITIAVANDESRTNDVVAKVLAVVLRANRWIKSDPQEAQQAHIEGSAKESLDEGKLQARLFEPSSFVDVSFLERIESDPALVQFIQRP